MSPVPAIKETEEGLDLGEEFGGKLRYHGTRYPIRTVLLKGESSGSNLDLNIN